MARKILIVCGILSSLLYVGTDIIAAMQWEDYSYASQTISELMAIGAPTRPFVITLFGLSCPLIIAFGIGVLRSADGNRARRITGFLLIAYGIVNLTAPFFPMHLRGAEKTLTDTMHKIFTMIDVFLILMFMGFGAASRGKLFRIYTIGTILLLVILGSLSGGQASRIEAQLPTPWVGAMERVLVYSSMLWVLVLAIALLGEDIRRKSQLTT